MVKAKRTNPLVLVIERSLAPGTFIPYGRSWDFVRGLEKIKDQIDATVKAGEARDAVELYEVFLAGCYDKANELDDSGGNLGMFFHELFVSWIEASQQAGRDPEETVQSILRWLDSDDYGFCYQIEGEVAKTLNTRGLALFKAHFEQRLDTALTPFKATERQCIHEYPWEVRKPVAALKLIYVARNDLRSYVDLCEMFIPSPRDCENIANLCKAKRRLADALAWVERGLQAEGGQRWGNESSYGLQALRRELLRKLGRREEALDAAWAEFAKAPSAYGYADVMKYVPKNQRPKWHQRAMQEAENASLGGFIDICVDTKEWERLATRTLAVDHEALENLSHYVTEKAAKGLERRHPGVAAKVYCALAMRILKAGKSKYYAFALEHLRTVKRLYEKLGAADAWQMIVVEVRRDHSRKRGFLSGFEEIVAGGAGKRSESFAEQARRRWKEHTAG